jgi:hypothetical protein
MDEPNDFIDAYLMEQKKCEKIGDPHYYSWVLDDISVMWWCV